MRLYTRSVTALGDFLEAVHGAHRSLRSVQGTLREYRDEHLIRSLGWDYWPDEDGDNRRWTGDDEFEQFTDFKLALPDRVRVETRLPGDKPNSIVVCDGSRRTTWFREWGADVEDEDRSNVSWVLGPVGRLLDPFWALGFLEFDAPRQSQHAGRQVSVARGHPRYPLPWPFGPADEHKLVVDQERGTLIRLVGLCRRGEAFVHELVELEHDVTFDDESFALVPPGVVTGLGLREAASLAGFQLWALPRPVLDVTYRDEPVESVTLTYDETTLVLTPASVRQAFVSFGELEQIDRGDRSYLLMPGEIVFAEDDTSIRLWHSTATRDELIDLAESLVPLY
jgi:hypothetical protein